MEEPKVGSNITIISYKHDGSFHRKWESSMLLKHRAHPIIGNYHAQVSESNGEHWQTREPAIGFFRRDRWYNIIAMIRDTGIFYYCNLGSPVRWKNGTLTYIDYDLDVKVFPNGDYIILDKDEFSEHRAAMNYDKATVTKIYQGLDQLLYLIKNRKGPFHPSTVEMWYQKYMQFQPELRQVHQETFHWQERSEKIN
ncbi:DUF402 domain-containing protein [Rubeoparvulum massiliense]|uniref:DUF402 domain-containing protein n=1 Tax=Rubeoparvulum massiliense TaxID=1631346 RepID=UPI0009771D35|nr:DUF402 domain-containing protein [Rubeoparvulum massiliense]